MVQDSAARVQLQRLVKDNRAIALLILGCIGAIALLQVPQLRRLQNPSETLPLAELQGQLAAEAASLDVVRSLPSFGVGNLIANWTFLNFLQYFGDTEARTRTDYSLSPQYFDIIVKHDPFFLRTYQYISTSTSQYAGQPERTVQLLNQGLERMSPTFPPESYLLWRYKGIDELLFLGNASAARQSFETAANWAEASGLPDSAIAADISRQTAEFLVANPDSNYAQFSAWLMVLQTAPDSTTQDNAAQRIEALGGSFIRNPDGTFQVRPPAQD
ncbi:MAG: hypothetical protein KME20_07195 [Kaiparowitsia implicata GSE-PSE-MK54-09C]|jgi:hypothetical protein|nr:hypothetical protein [Kaiparowitsia implicata GSE-PSE-MK54-09C]